MAMDGPGAPQPAGDPSALLQAVSADVGPEGEASVVLVWEGQPGFVGYNLYRRTAAAAASRARRVNGTRMIRAAARCAELRRFVAEGSREWSILANAFSSVALRADPAAPPVNPCEAMDRGLNPEEATIFDGISSSCLALRLARGTAFVDRRAVAERQYAYELRGVLADDSEVVLARDVLVWAGHFILPDPPSGLSATVGDRKVLTLWNRNPYAATYAVQRATSPGGPYLPVNPEPVAMDVEQDIDNAPVVPPRPGFLDFQRWTLGGTPDTHVVDGWTIAGPDNGTTYYYRVASRDNLDRLGAWSAAVSAVPVRSTPPMAPDEVQVTAEASPEGLVVSWRKVTRDVDNHELPDASQSYDLFRADVREDLEDVPALATHLVATIYTDPSDPTTPTLSWTDTDPVLVQPYGEKTFFYRLACSDPLGNTSAPSAIIGGFVPDTRPPGRTDPDGAEGFPDHIRVYWRPNGEPDLAGYQIYRGVCDRGEMYTPGKEKERGRCDLTLVGQVTLAEAEEMLAATGRIHFDDFSVPEGSPLCYGYWVRAYDAAQNLYDGNRGCPWPGEYSCMRLLEKTPPPAPIVTGLRARNDAVQVEWIASPVQDLRAFHVYRTDAEFDPPAFLGCVFIDGTTSPTPWPGLVPSCVDIPAEPDPLAARGEFLDVTAVPGEIYWYRVSALDWLGNESESADLTRLPSSSTFTYSNDRPVIPVADPPTAITGPECGLDIHWGPAFDPVALGGFVVFRSAGGGPYRQVSGIVAGNSFADLSARRGVRYAYRIQSIDGKSRLSEPSSPVVGIN